MHDAYDFNKPWDSLENLAVTRNTPPVFRCPSAPGSPDTTHYVVITGRDTCFDGGKGITLREITDGAFNTLLVVEAHESSIPWYEPRDLDVSVLGGGGASAGLSSSHPGGFNAAYCDGKVLFVNESTAPNTIRAQVTPARGEQVEAGEF